MSRAWCTGICLAVVLFGCGHGASTAPAQVPPLPRSFTPSPPLPDPEPITGQPRGRQLLVSMAEALQPRWSSFLEDLRLRLPPGHVLNQPALAATIDIVLTADGALADARVATSSGQVELDRAALEVVRDAQPFDRPDRSLVSDDGLYHLRWLFARDRRQAGPATAEVEIVHLPLARAIPALVAEGEIDVALARIAAGEDRPEARVRALDQVALGLLRVDLLGRPERQMAALAAAELSRARELQAPVEAILSASGSPERRAAATVALVAMGASPEVLVAVASEDRGVVAPLAARALVGTPEADQVVAAAGARLREGGSAGALALDVLAELPAPALVGELETMARTGSRQTRLAAIRALGASATRSEDALHGVVALLRDRDAGIRAAACSAITRALPGLSNRRRIFVSTIALVRDRDQRVRAACGETAALADPERFARELYRVRRDRSLAVRQAMARALGRVPGKQALALTLHLAEATEPAVRQAAVISLAQRGEAQARAALVALARDADASVAAAATEHIDDVALLESIAGGTGPAQVRARALARWARARGRAAVCSQAARAIANSHGTERTLLAAGWLAAASSPSPP